MAFWVVDGQHVLLAHEKAKRGIEVKTAKTQLARNDGATNATVTRMSENLGYHYSQRNRRFAANPADGAATQGTPTAGFPNIANAADASRDATFGYKLMKFRIKASGLLSCDKMLHCK